MTTPAFRRLTVFFYLIPICLLFSPPAPGQIQVSDLVRNANFEEGFLFVDDDSVPVDWERFETFPGGEQSFVRQNSADNGPSHPGQNSTVFTRENDTSSMDSTTIEQEIGANGRSFESVTLGLDVCIFFHDL